MLPLPRLRKGKLLMIISAMVKKTASSKALGKAPIQATRATQKQLAYLAYWQRLGYQFGRGDVIPESTEIPPKDWFMPRWCDLAVTAVGLLAILVLVNEVGL
jgi:hypothetical protein